MRLKVWATGKIPPDEDSGNTADCRIEQRIWDVTAGTWRVRISAMWDRGKIRAARRAVLIFNHSVT